LIHLFKILVKLIFIFSYPQLPTFDGAQLMKKIRYC